MPRSCEINLSEKCYPIAINMDGNTVKALCISFQLLFLQTDPRWPHECKSWESGSGYHTRPIKEKSLGCFGTNYCPCLWYTLNGKPTLTKSYSFLHCNLWCQGKGSLHQSSVLTVQISGPWKLPDGCTSSWDVPFSQMTLPQLWMHLHR